MRATTVHGSRRSLAVPDDSRQAGALVLAVYITGHGYGHMTRTLEVVRAIRDHHPALPITVVGAVPEREVRRVVEDPVVYRPVPCDVGLIQRDAVRIDLEATSRRCRELDDAWEVRVAAEVEFLRSSGTRVVLCDTPALPFEAAARIELPSFALANFGWDWVYRHLAPECPSLLASAGRAARAYGFATMLLELPFADGLSSFRRRERIGLVARRPKALPTETRRLLGLDARPAALVSFGGTGMPEFARGLRSDGDLQYVTQDEVATLGLEYPDVIAAVDAIVTKPGYGMFSEALAAGTRVVYVEPGANPEHQVLARDISKYVPAARVPLAAISSRRIEDAVLEVVSRPRPAPFPVPGTERAACSILEAMAG